MKIFSYRRYWENGKTNVCFCIICSHGCTRRNLCFHVENCRHADQKQLTRRHTFDLDIESTHGQPASCRARPVKVDDDLEEVRWIRGLGGEKLPVASYALLRNPKGVYFLQSERDRDFLSPVSAQPRPNVFVLRRLAGARHVSPAVL